MYRQQLLPIAAPTRLACLSSKPLGDEVWAADSDSDCESTASGSGCESDSASSGPGAPMLFAKLPITRPVERPAPQPAPALGVLDKAASIRLDNDLLRNAIVKAHRDAEAAVAMPLRSESSGQCVHLSHLLELVKDFGDGLGGLGPSNLEGEAGSTSAGIEAIVDCISISTPRRGKDATVSEVARLQAELATSKREADELRSMLAARKAEIAQAKLLASKGH